MGGQLARRIASLSSISSRLQFDGHTLPCEAWCQRLHCSALPSFSPNSPPLLSPLLPRIPSLDRRIALEDWAEGVGMATTALCQVSSVAMATCRLCLRSRSMGGKNGGVGRREAQPAATSWRMPCTTCALPPVMSQMAAMGPSCHETSWHAACTPIQRPPQLSNPQVSRVIATPGARPTHRAGKHTGKLGFNNKRVLNKPVFNNMHPTTCIQLHRRPRLHVLCFKTHYTQDSLYAVGSLYVEGAPLPPEHRHSRPRCPSIEGAARPALDGTNTRGTRHKRARPHAPHERGRGEGGWTERQPYDGDPDALVPAKRLAKDARAYSRGPRHHQRSHDAACAEGPESGSCARMATDSMTRKHVSQDMGETRHVSHTVTL